MSTNIKTCPSCGGAVDPNARFCFSCGHDLSSSAPPVEDDSLAPEQGMPHTSTAMNDEVAHAGTVSASIGSAPEGTMSGDVGVEPAFDTSISAPASGSNEPATPAESTSFANDPAASDVYESASLSEGSATGPDSASVSTTYFEPASTTSDTLGFDTSVESGQPQTTSTTTPQDATSNTDSPGTDQGVAGAASDTSVGDSWYNALSSSPGGSISSDTLRISPAPDSSPGASTVNIGEQNAGAANPGYAPPPPPPAPDSSATTTAFTPPPSFSPAPMQPPPQGGYSGYTSPPMQQPQGQAFYTPPPQQLDAQQPYMPPPQYTQPPPTTQMQGYSNYQQPVYPATSQYSTAMGKDPTVALLLELIGYAGILGIGHIYAGRTNRGIALLVGWLVYVFAASILSFVCIGCVMFIAWPFVPIASGLWIKNDLEKERAMGMPR